MSATNGFETSLLNLIFTNADITGVARGASSAGNFYISLHTANPNEGGAQNTNEATYTSYARVSVARSNVQWTVSGNNASNTNAIVFPVATGGTNTITHWGLGLSTSGAGTLLFYGALDNSLAVSTGIRPIFDAGDLQVQVD